jgi:hypothetical protein
MLISLIFMEGGVKGMLQVSDISELAYGGLVTFAERQDADRITAGKLANDKVFSKYGTYAYFVPGLISVGAVAMNWMPRYAGITNRIAHGFIYDIPRQTMNLVDALKKTSAAVSTRPGAKPAWRPNGIVA